MYFKIKLFTALLLFSSINLWSQDISAIHIQGTVEVINPNEVGSKNLVYGPIKSSTKVKVGKNSRVKFIRSKDEICDINKEGVYKVSELSFVSTEGNSALARFCDYFHSFFISHSSSEAKETYKNSISAISRGDMPPVHLDFPMKGLLPVDAGDISFGWSHQCDTCEYILSVSEFDSKALVFYQESKSNSVILQNPAEYLLPGKKYFWRVQIKNSDSEIKSSSFTIPALGDYDKNIVALKQDLMSLNNEDNIPSTIYVMSQLDDKELVNYAIMYGKYQQNKSPNDDQLRDICDAFLYQKLLDEL